MNSPLAQRLAKPLVFLLCLLPMLWLLYGAWRQQLGAHPVEFLSHQTGEWALRLLLITLAITPLCRLSGWRYPMRIRRMLGLYTFFYATVHMLVYAALDLQFDWAYLAEDILERPYLTIGFTAWMLLVPLAVTSNRAMMKKLGSRWKRLHRLVYLIAIAGVVHFIWLVKKDLFEPLVYTAILAVLLLLRLPVFQKK